MSPSRLLALAGPLLAALLLVGTLEPVTSASGAPEIVLGSPGHLAPTAEGWGTASPRHVFNGGDPSGEISHLNWLRWGGSTAKARGLTWLLRPEGGYYARPGRIVIRAADPGLCPDGTFAYRLLQFKIAREPGGPVGTSWHRWGGDGNIC